jgi:cysteine synthase A
MDELVLSFAHQNPRACAGIGIGRLTANFALAHVDAAFDGDEQETLDMAYYLARREGVFVGPSAALNV